MDYQHNKKLTPKARTLRKNMTDAERRLWYGFLRDYPVRFLRQKVIDHYIVDFYCRRARLVVEVDGSQHYEDEGEQKDQNRTEELQKRGLTVIRIPNNLVRTKFEGVCAYLDEIVKLRLKEE